MRSQKTPHFYLLKNNLIEILLAALNNNTGFELFSIEGLGNIANMPATEVPAEKFAEDGTVGAIDLLVISGLCSSNGDARRNIQQGGVEIAGNKVTDVAVRFTKEDLAGDGVVVKRGKKNFHRVFVK